MATSYKRTKEFKGTEYTLERNDLDFGDTHRVVLEDAVSPWFPKMKYAISYAELALGRDVK